MRFSAATSILLLILFSGCSKPSAEESFARAQASEKEARRALDSLLTVPDMKVLFAPAVEQYSRIIEERPQSAFAEQALFMRATIRNNDTREPQLAVDDYKRYAELYPDSEKAPLAMFLTGYIYNNDLHNLDSAAAAYKRFLATYPGNEMAMSAQFELSTLGKSPEELIPQSPPQQGGNPGAAAMKPAGK